MQKPNLLFFMTDVETDGSQAPCMGEMTELGCVLVTKDLTKTFYWDFNSTSTNLKKELGNYNAGIKHATSGMTAFETWINDKCKEYNGVPIFISDNNGFDWQFVNHNFWQYLGRNPFGHSSQNLGSLYKGFRSHFSESFKHLRRTKHDHNPVNDAMGNAEAFLTFAEQIGINIPK